MEDDVMAFLESEDSSSKKKKKKKKKKRRKKKEEEKKKIEKKKQIVEKKERRIDDVGVEEFVSETSTYLNRFVQEWKAKRDKGTDIITSIINIRSEISHVNSLESLSEARDGVDIEDAKNESEASLWYRVQKLHRQLEIVHNSLENMYQDIIDIYCKAESLMRLPGLNIDVLNGHSKSDHMGLQFYTNLIVEIEIMFSQSIFLKHMVYKQILSRNADYKQLVTLVSLWDTEPNVDMQRMNEILDLLNLSSRKG